MKYLFHKRGAPVAMMVALLVLALVGGHSILNAWVLGRMTGGGSVFKGDLRITHGFELYCQPEPPAPVIGPNNLEVNFDGNHFHLDTLTEGRCELGPDPKPPAAPISIYNGRGVGSYNGVAGYLISWVFVDAGEPGVNDTATYTILTPDGSTVVLHVDTTVLTFGNHQAHFLTGGKVP
jgi:hypothetical protein